MNREIREQINHYKGLWAEMADYGSVISSCPESKGFFVRRHSFARSDILENNWYSEYTDEMYDSPFDCLACYRWYVIPERLREASGLSEETDLDLLLDGAGYSASLIAEELFCMIDLCLDSGCCSENGLHRIRQAYNGLSGFQDDFVSRIVQWGSNRGVMSPDMKAAGINGSVMFTVRNPYYEGFHSGYFGKPANNPSRTSASGVFAG
ncbi:MAG: hypothetical protein K8S24_05200 [Candidatus Aegiribacteria sp.]|nr:hypothetical protein [Candidatus Aegiribacteria sp.]